MLEKIEELIRIEINNRIKKMELIHCDDIISQIKMRYNALNAQLPDNDEIKALMTRREIKAELRALLQLVESARYGYTKNNESVEQRVAAL